MDEMIKVKTIGGTLTNDGRYKFENASFFVNDLEQLVIKKDKKLYVFNMDKVICYWFEEEEK